MTDEEFMFVVIDAYQRAIDAGEPKAQAHKIAEQFRSGLIKSLALASTRNKAKIAEIDRFEKACEGENFGPSNDEESLDYFNRHIAGDR